MKVLLFAGATALLAVIGFLAWPAFDRGPAPVETADGGNASSTTTTDAPSIAATDGPGTVAPRQPVAASTTTSPPAMPADRGGFHGRLLDPEGNPLPGSVVRCVAIDGPRLFLDGAGLVERVTTTDTEGRFRFDDLPRAAEASLVADDGGDLRQIVPVPGSVAAGRSTDLGDVQLVIRGTVVGTVLDAGGKRLANAEVLACDVPIAALAVLPAQILDPRHGILMTLPKVADPIGTDLEARQREVRSGLVRLGKRPVTDLSADAVSAHVLDTKTFEPFWNALPVSRTRTDADGSFRLGGLDAGPQTLIVRARGHAVSVQPGIEAASPLEPTDVGVIELDAGNTLYGFVGDPDGNPVGGAEVRVAPIGLAGFFGGAAVTAPITTRADGTFEMAGLARGRVLVVARRNADEPWALAGPFGSGDDAEVELPATAECKLEVTLPDGVDPASLTVHTRPTGLVGEFGTTGLLGAFREILPRRDDAGRLVVGPLTHGTWMLRVTADGCAPREVLVDLPCERPFAFELPAAHPVAVRVLRHDGTPAPDAEVFVQTTLDLSRMRVLPSSYGLSQWTDVVPRTAVRTTADGTARLDAVPAGARITARSATDGVATTMLDVERPARDVELRLGGAGRIDGVVRVGPLAEHEPQELRAVLSQSYRSYQDGIPAFEPAATIAADGTFTIEHVPAADYTVELRPRLRAGTSLMSLFEAVERVASIFGDRNGQASQGVSVAPGSTNLVEFAIGGADASLGQIEGVVRVDGEPTSGLRVYTRRSALKTDEPGVEFSGFFSSTSSVDSFTDGEGRFTLVDLAPGLHDVVVEDPKNSDKLAATLVEVAAGRAAAASIDVRTGRVVGRLLDPDGRPAGGEQVTASHVFLDERGALASDTRMAKTDASGTFRFDALPVGKWSLSIFSDRLLGNVPRFEVHEGETRSVDFPADWNHTLTVRLAASEPLQERGSFGVHAFPLGSHAGSSTITNQREIEMHLRKAGTYELWLHRDGKTYRADPPTVEVQGLKSEVEVRFGPAEPLPDR